MSDGDEVRCAGRLFHRLAAKTGKARLPAKYHTVTWLPVEYADFAPKIILARGNNLRSKKQKT